MRKSGFFDNFWCDAFCLRRICLNFPGGNCFLIATPIIGAKSNRVLDMLISVGKNSFMDFFNFMTHGMFPAFWANIPWVGRISKMHIFKRFQASIDVYNRKTPFPYFLSPTDHGESPFGEFYNFIFGESNK